jgi:hypothetical protein
MSFTVFPSIGICVVSRGFDVVESLSSTTCTFFYFHVCILMYDADYLNNGNQLFDNSFSVLK